MPIKIASLGNPQAMSSPSPLHKKRLTKADLMGELGHLLALPAYQLALPFTHEAWRQLEYTRVLTGTTLGGTTYRDLTEAKAARLARYAELRWSPDASLRSESGGH